jgi:PIN domain nuclease of toxin-antitoxin system
MKLLLDTHIFLWLDSSPEKLSQRALVACEDPANQLYLSVVSAWEIQIKRQINRLQLGVPLNQMIRGQQSTNDLRILPVELQHIYVLDELPLHHSDPEVDEQAIAERLGDIALIKEVRRRSTQVGSLRLSRPARGRLHPWPGVDHK